MPAQAIETGNDILFSTKEGNVYHIERKKYFQKSFSLGSSRMHNVQQFGGKKLLISNMDGKIALFEFRK